LRRISAVPPCRTIPPETAAPAETISVPPETFVATATPPDATTSKPSNLITAPAATPWLRTRS